MILNVVDLEFNQPSRNIIQIGAVSVDVKSGKFLSEFSTYVNPNELLDPYIVSLCGISQEQADAAPQLRDALGSFFAQLASKSIAAWGSDHQVILRSAREQMILPAVDNFNEFNLLETANLLRCAYTGSRQGGLVKTMNLFGLEFEGKQHDAKDDAKNTARLLLRMVQMLRKQIQIENLMAE